jgi:hypothetical protein
MSHPSDNPLVFHTAYELGQLHGPNAHGCVAKLAADALKRGDTERYEFWKSVKLALPRHKKSRIKSAQKGRA